MLISSCTHRTEGSIFENELQVTRHLNLQLILILWQPLPLVLLLGRFVSPLPPPARKESPKIRTQKLKIRLLVFLSFFFRPCTLRWGKSLPFHTTDGFKCSDYKILTVKWFNYKVNTASNLGWAFSVKTTDGAGQALGQCLTRPVHNRCRRVFHGASVSHGAHNSWFLFVE